MAAVGIPPQRLARRRRIIDAPAFKGIVGDALNYVRGYIAAGRRPLAAHSALPESEAVAKANDWCQRSGR